MKTYKEYPIIVKPFGYGEDGYKGTGAIILDLSCETIDVECIKGPAPYARDILLFLAADKDVRRMAHKYQKTSRSRDYALRTSQGMSGRQDFYINYYDKHGLQIGGELLLHKSCFDKLNEGWCKMWIGDYVELFAYIMRMSGADYDLSKPRIIRRKSGCWYIKGYFCDDASCAVSKIF